MFGMSNNDQASMGAPTVQNPSMLDNVSAQDFQTPTPPPQEPVQNDNTGHAITSDNPFLQQDTQTPQAVMPQPAVQAIPSLPAEDTPVATVTPVASDASSPSAPVAPPTFTAPVDDTPATTPIDSLVEESLPSTDSTPVTVTESSNAANEPIDQDKLADLKREALEHLEPLADHIDGTPEETFRTTMMMIQANDNHLLLQKALDAAKKIDDDKARAQAMLDIINEINYFSQIGPS